MISKLAILATICAAGLPAAPTVSRVWSFKGSNGSSENLVLHNGRLYGGLSPNAPYPAGAVFELTPPKSGQGDWSETVIYSATDTYASPVFDVNGALYGATYRCSDGGDTCFTVFQLTPPSDPKKGNWTSTVLYQLSDIGNAGLPPSLAVSNGILYGTLPYGGANNYGMFFQLTPPASAGYAWNFTALYNFMGGSDGGNPTAFVLDTAGNVFGTAYCSGSMDCSQFSYGTVFELTPPPAQGGAWTETTLIQLCRRRRRNLAHHHNLRRERHAVRRDLSGRRLQWLHLRLQLRHSFPVIASAGSGRRLDRVRVA